MPSYLLSTQSLLDRISGKPEYAIFDWLKSQSTRETNVYISAVSIGVALSEIERLDPLKRDKYREGLDNIVANLKPGAILPFDESMASTYSKIKATAKRECRYVGGRAGTPQYTLTDADMMMIAVAMGKNYTLIEPAQPYHAALIGHGLKVETLGE